MTLFLLAILFSGIFLLFVFVMLKRNSKINNKKSFLKLKNNFNVLLQLPIKNWLGRIQNITYNNFQFQDVFLVFKNEYNNVIKKYQEIIKTKIKKLEEQKFVLESEIFEEELQKLASQINLFEDKVYSFWNRLKDFLKVEDLFYQEISKCKTLFHNVKKEFSLKEKVLTDQGSHIKKIIAKIEQQFITFEQMIKKAQYPLIKKIILQLHDDLKHLIFSLSIDVNQKMFLDEKIPKIISQIKRNFNEKKLAKPHLLIEDEFAKIPPITKRIDEIKKHLDEGEFLKNKVLIERVLNDLSTTYFTIEKEDKADTFITQKFSRLMNYYYQIYKNLNFVDGVFEELIANVDLTPKEMAICNEVKSNKDQFHLQYNTLLAMFKDQNHQITLYQNLQNFHHQALKMGQLISDSLTLIMNRDDFITNCFLEFKKQKLIITNLDFHSHKITASDKKDYQRHLTNVNEVLKEVDLLLKETTIDFKMVNAKLKQSQEIINAIQNLFDLTSTKIATQKKAIMFLNRFRFKSLEINNKLKKIEVFFNNKEYNKSDKLIKECLDLDIIQKWKE